MVISTGTLDRYGLGSRANSDDNVREDLSDVIYNISPTEVPFQSNSGREKSATDFKEWLIDDLAVAANNAHIDGDEFTGTALTVADRVGNYHQISRKDLVVSRRSNIVNKAGRRSEMAYQVAKGGKELRRDIEVGATSRKAAAPGSSGVAPEAAGVPAWIRTNDDLASGMSSPTLSATDSGYPNTVDITGTDRALTESQFLTSCRVAYDEGGNPNMFMLPPRLKQGFSNFLFGTTSNRVATQYQDQGKANRGGISVVGAVDVYVTDFEVMDIVPNRFSPSGVTQSEAFILDTEFWAMSYLDGYHVEDIAQIGDARRRMLIVDWTVVSKNEASSAIIGGLIDTSAVTA